MQARRAPPAPPDAWADLPKVLDLAKRENAVIKVSGACTLSHKPYPYPDIWEPLARVFDAWGFDRCLWGTDWTRAFAVVNYEQAVEPFLRTDRLTESERAMLMGGACAKAYGWSPDKRVASRSGAIASVGRPDSSRICPFSSRKKGSSGLVRSKASASASALSG